MRPLNAGAPMWEGQEMRGGEPVLTLALKGSGRHPLGKRRILVQVKLESIEHDTEGRPIAVIEVSTGRDTRTLPTRIGELHDLMLEVS